MSSYGLAFLKREHRIDDTRRGGRALPSSLSWLGGGSAGSASGAYSSSLGADQLPSKVVVKSDIEKQHDVVTFLLHRTGRAAATSAEVEANTGVDLDGADVAVKAMLDQNPKVEIKNDDNPSVPTLYMYYAKYNVNDRRELRALVNRCKNGISATELHDTYDEVLQDIEDMQRAGEAICIENKETRQLILYPRGPKFLTKLQGSVRVDRLPDGSSEVKVCGATEDLSKDICRGEAVRISDQWFRVSREELGGGLKRSVPQTSVTNSLEKEEAREKREYLFPFEEQDYEGGGKILPLHTPFVFKEGEHLWEGQAVRHGACQTLRTLWRETREEIPSDEAKLQERLRTCKLTSRTAETHRRKIKNFHLENNGLRETQRARQKRRKLLQNPRTERITNTHLEGTEIGRLLEEARLNPDLFAALGSAAGK